jgi:L,D-peptidoglycan transpeptidase YkuD (ErfK/YbiS/YcfS/YnhG family)
VRSRGSGVLFAVIAVSIVATACGRSAPRAETTTTRIATTGPARITTTGPASTAVSTTTPTPPRTTPATAAPTTAAPTTAAASSPAATYPARTTPPAPASYPTTPPAPAPLLVTQLHGIGGAQQVITVAANGYGTSTATVTAFARDASGWRQVFGPWFAYIGRNGVAPAGAKREGDGRTPSGVYGFDFMFGVDPDPGVNFPYRNITSSSIVWDDDPSSPNYNEWIDTRTAGVAAAGADPEPMQSTPSYDYGAVIAYNDARTPGLGSAIFLHVSHGSSTAGCVSLPTDELLDVLRWLDPVRSPLIVIGTTSSLAS